MIKQSGTTNAAIGALTDAATTMATDIGSVITTVAPIVLGLAVSVTVLFIGWRIIRKMAGKTGG